MSIKRGNEKRLQWLSYCLSIGWPREDLGELERLWLMYHDICGNWRRPWRI